MSKTYDPKGAAKRAIDILGGPSKAARRLDVKDHRYQTVQSWLANGVPAKYCPAVERETTLEGQPVLCEELCNEADWSVLRTKHPRKPSEHASAKRGTDRPTNRREER